MAGIVINGSGSLVGLTTPTTADGAMTVSAEQLQLVTAYTTGGTSIAYTMTTLASAVALTTNECWSLTFNQTCGAAPTLARDGLTAQNLKYYDANGTKQSCTSAQIVTNLISRVVYDGTDYVVLTPATKNNIVSEDSLTQYYYPSLDGNYRDLYRSGWLPYCFNQQCGGAQWGNLADGSFGSHATCQIQDDTALAVGNVTTAGFYRYQPFKVSEAMSNITVAIKAFKTANPVDNLTIGIYSDNAGVPNALLGGAGVLSGKAITSKTDGEEYRIATTCGALVAGTQYHIVISKSGGVDAVNYYNVKATTRSAYPHGVSGTGTNVPAWAAVAGTALCFKAENPAANSLLQSGGLFDYTLSFNNGTPWNQSRFLAQPVVNFISGDEMTVLHRGVTVANSNVLDFAYGIDHDRITVTTNASNFPVLTVYCSDRTAHTITGTVVATKDLGFKVRLVGDGADYATLYADGVSTGTPLTAQTFSFNNNFKLRGTAILGGGFGLAPTWSVNPMTDTTNLPSHANNGSCTWTGTGTEANCYSMQGGEGYQNANGYASTDTGYYLKTIAGVNGTGTEMVAGLRVVTDTNAVNTPSCFMRLSDGTISVTVRFHEYFIEVVSNVTTTTAADFIVQGNFKSSNHVYLLSIKGSDYFLKMDGKLLVDGTGKAVGSSGAANNISWGDLSATAGMNSDAIWSEVKCYVGGMILPTANTGSCSEFAHWAGDKSALLPSLYNAGTPVSIKQLCGVPRNYQYEQVVQRIVQRGVVLNPTVTNASYGAMPEMEGYVIGSDITVISQSLVSNSTAGSYGYAAQFLDGVIDTQSLAVSTMGTTASTYGNLTSMSKHSTPVGLHKSELRWSANLNTETCLTTDRVQLIEARS